MRCRKLVPLITRRETVSGTDRSSAARPKRDRQQGAEVQQRHRLKPSPVCDGQFYAEPLLYSPDLQSLVAEKLMANLFSPPTATDVKGGRFGRNGTSHNLSPAVHADGQSTT